MLVLVLGANSDIALSTCRHFAESEKPRFIFAGRNMHELQRHAHDFSLRHNVRVDTKPFDASDFPAHELFYQRLEEKPDVVILAFGDEARHYDNSFAKAKHCIDVNYLGAVSILDPIAKDMLSKKSGSLIVISSVAGDRGRKKNHFYGAAKAALTAYLSGLRQILHPEGILVLTVLPGITATKMTAGLAFPPLITGKADTVGRDIYRAFKKRRLVLYTPLIWRIIMGIIRIIPESIFARMKF